MRDEGGGGGEGQTSLRNKHSWVVPHSGYPKDKKNHFPILRNSDHCSGYDMWILNYKNNSKWI